MYGGISLIARCQYITFFDLIIDFTKGIWQKVADLPQKENPLLVRFNQRRGGVCILEKLYTFSRLFVHNIKGYFKSKS